MHTCMCAQEVSAQRSGDSLQDFILSFHHVASRDQPQAASLGSKRSYPWAILTALIIFTQ